MPVTTTVEHFENNEIVTYNYEVGKKTFVAVVKYDKVTKKPEIIEVNPVIVTKPVKIDQTIV